MSRSKQRSKCTRVGCLLCKPHKASGEASLAVLRATVDDPRDIALEEDPFEFDYDDDWCPHCDHPFAVGAMAHHVAFRCAVLLYAERYRNLLDRLAMLDGGLWSTMRPTLPEAEMDDARFMRSIEQFASEAADVSHDAANWDDDLRDNVCDTAEWLLLDGVRRMASGSLPPDVFARIGSAWLTIAKTDLGALGVNVRALLSLESSSRVELLIKKAMRQAWLSGDPAPSEGVLTATREVYRELTAEGLDASDITHDALGGIAITIGNAAAFAWVSLRNDAPATVRFLGERDGGPPIPVAAGFVKRIAEHVRSPPEPHIASKP